MKVCKANIKPLCMKWKNIDTNMLFVLVSMYAKAIPQLQYDNKYKGKSSFIGVPIRWRLPNTKLDIVINRKLFVIILLNPNLKTHSSNKGAKITADIKVYSGNIWNSFLIVVSLVDMPPPNILIKMLAAIITITLIT